ncbi:MAG: 2-oxoacid:acceptor oxidoreductase subunit alpha [Ectothiorhodospiraceae bacterium]|nr:2-oxoacid:acceptor oxidoreductase subunit alpha [Chromatiales bacterium]MCP5153777.1 2-oxoacid:acceptor oxidoreductase subunit alpha [Ectothiorhodospiraceae bacterium]
MRSTLSIALTGSGGAGVVTAGRVLLDAATRAGWYGLLRRSSGPQIRGGESAALLRLGAHPVDCLDDHFDVLVALDWGNIERFADEIPLVATSLVLSDPSAGAVPAAIAAKGAQHVALPLRELATAAERAPENMVAAGALCAALGVDAEHVEACIEALLGRKGGDALTAAVRGARAGAAGVPAACADLALPAMATRPAHRWALSGNEAAGLGALRGGVRFVAAYPITPASELLEWLAPRLTGLGGALVQAEDELASINMCLGASYGGVPSLTATSGPGLALMTEGLGLAVAGEIPVVVVDVMRGGPSTGIPTKSEQTDLDIALNGLHGDAPHLVLAPVSVADCAFTTQWAVHLAETLQAPAIVLSDQALGQTRVVTERPADVAFLTRRRVASPDQAEYRRYAAGGDGIAAMAVPGTPGTTYTAEGLEHDERGTPSSSSGHHARQLARRTDKLDRHDYGPWATLVEGDGDTAIVTWGSTCGAVREAAARERARGRAVRVVAPRLLAPARHGEVDGASALERALDGVERVLVVEQSHSRQFHRYLRAWHDLPRQVRCLARPGPLPIAPEEVRAALGDWSQR